MCLWLVLGGRERDVDGGCSVWRQGYAWEEEDGDVGEGFAGGECVEEGGGGGGGGWGCYAGGVGGDLEGWLVSLVGL